MRASISVLLAVGLCAAPADASRSDEHLELSSVEESIDDDGFSVFTGSIRNTSLVQAVIPHIYVVLKKDGVVVSRYRGSIALEHVIKGLAPSRSASFHIGTEHEPGDYDEFHISLRSEQGTIDLDSIEGSLDLIKESVTLTTGVYLFVEHTIIYGELVNNTNAVVTDIVVEFDLFDGRRSLGTASTRFIDTLQFIELGPGETIDFAAQVPRGTENRIDEWEATISFSVVELVFEDMPTAITETSWGQVKHGRGP